VADDGKYGEPGRWQRPRVTSTARGAPTRRRLSRSPESRLRRLQHSSVVPLGYRSTRPPSNSRRSTRYLSIYSNSTVALSIGADHPHAMVKQKRNAPQPDQAAREAVLQKALRDVLRGVAPEPGASTTPSQRSAASRDRERRRWMSNELHAEQAAFLQGITATANLLAAVRDSDGEPIYPTDARYNLLAALQRIGGWPSIAELARVQRVSKQAAREQVIGATRAGLLELLPDPQDRRAIQIGLTASGKRELAAVRTRQFNLVATLLNGLKAREMRLVAHVLSVIRDRLNAVRRDSG
jgi:DNA-binding MarR family transcriptional regulator